MVFLKSFLFSVIVALGLSACGGSDKEFAVPISHDLDGRWSTDCLFDASTNLAEIEVITIDGKLLRRESSLYETSDCSGVASQDVTISANIDYQGQQATSVCLAEKIDITSNELTLDGVRLDTQQLSNFLQNSNIPNPEFDIACVSSNILFFGDKSFIGNDGSSTNRRPPNIDISRGFFRVNNDQFTP